jgi:hypothetical protein
LEIFVADMTGTKAVGKGIVPTVIGLVNRYKIKKLMRKLMKILNDIE